MVTPRSETAKVSSPNDRLPVELERAVGNDFAHTRCERKGTRSRTGAADAESERAIESCLPTAGSLVAQRSRPR